MPSQDANPNVRMLQAQTLSVTTKDKSQALERRRQVAYRTYLSTTAFVDPKHAKDGGVSMRDIDRSILWMDSGVQGPDGKMVQYYDSIAGVRTYHEPSCQSVATSTYLIGEPSGGAC
ncbi:unnamed protein product [Hyaloperonospora brassicae]|uniref:Uncharacterized protein n=1 Tax=Hyaloperonospora brassicae TaxID=162125 RepID=A0AAV0T5U2_HYABA|nr:unnamed protein product [Hyaloperonospora brassicae]